MCLLKKYGYSIGLIELMRGIKKKRLSHIARGIYIAEAWLEQVKSRVAGLSALIKDKNLKTTRML